MTKLEKLGERLKVLQAHDALCLLRNAFSFPKLLYALHTAPCYQSILLSSFDSLQRSLLESICNIHPTDSGWLQASLPAAFGGLGVRSAVMLAPSAFLADGASMTGHDCWHPNKRSRGLGLLLLRFQHLASVWGMKPSGLHAVGLRLGATLCVPHDCPRCGMQVDHSGVHGLSCRSSQGRVPRHTALNDIRSSLSPFCCQCAIHTGTICMWSMSVGW